MSENTPACIVTKLLSNCHIYSNITVDIQVREYFSYLLKDYVTFCMAISKTGGTISQPSGKTIFTGSGIVIECWQCDLGQGILSLHCFHIQLGC